MDVTPTDVELGAHRYVLHMLLQRLERFHPGLVEEMLRGAKADHAAMAAQGVDSPGAAEAVVMLDLVHRHNQMAQAAAPRAGEGS
jgi:hypothetical protein